MSFRALPFYKRLLIIILASIFVLYCLIWVLSSPIIKHFAKEPLAEFGLTLSDDARISFNPFLTRVDVKNLALLKNNEPVFKAKELAVQIALHKIPFSVIKLEEFLIDGVLVKINKNENDLFVAGVNLTPESTEQTTNEITTQEQSENNTSNDAPAEPSSFEVQLEELLLSNTLIDALVDGHPHQFTIKSLLISDVKASQTLQSATVKLSSILDDATININTKLDLKNNQGNINNSIEVSKYSLVKIKHFIEPVETLNGLVSLSSTQDIAILSDTIKVNVKDTTLSTDNVNASTKEQRIALSKLLYTMSDFKVEINTNEEQTNPLQNIAAQAQLTLSKATVEALPINVNEPNTQNENADSSGNTLPTILSFDELNLSNISPQLADNLTGDLAADLSINIDAINLDKLLFSQNTTTELPPVATINNINITHINGSAAALSINEINIDSLNSHVILNKEKALANLVNITSAESTNSDQAPAQTPEESKLANEKPSPDSTSKESTADTAADTATTEKPFYISLNALNVINDNTIDFIDNSVDPIYKRSLMIDALTVGKLSSTPESAENKTPILLKGRSNQYANFAFNGYIQPFAAKQTYHVKGDLNELSLPDVSTYMKDALKLVLKSGQLNTKLDITLVNDEIDGDVNISINGLETAAANDETNVVKDQVGIPFNIALGMLKDGNGDLVLDVPLSGKTSDPSFGISSFIALITKKAVMSATEDYLMTTFVPYANIVSVAMTAGEFILKIRFEDLPYQPKQIELNAEQDTYINQFTALMKDEEDTRVKICAISTPADIGLPAEQKLTTEQIKTLKTMGDEREAAFKEKVVKDGIDSGRILLCIPQIDSSEGAVPRMVISV